MNTMVPNLDPQNVLLKMNTLKPAPPDAQILYLCNKGMAFQIPLDILLSQYKYCLIHNNEARTVFKKALEEICPESLGEMEGLYASNK